MAAEGVPGKVVTFTLLTSVVTAPGLVLQYSQMSADAPGKENCWIHRMGDSVLEDDGSRMDMGIIVGSSHQARSQPCSRRATLGLHEKSKVELGG